MSVKRCPGPIRRREFLQAGMLSLGGGLALPDLLAARAVAGAGGENRAVILLYCHGGPTQLETYDLKPLAPLEYRSQFQPISTNVPGMDICELFPRQARIADKFSLVRSVHHKMSSHTDGGIEVLTGKTPTRPDPTSTSISEHPDLGSIASRVLGPHPDAIPRYVALPQKPYMTRPAYLGVHHGPFIVGDPNAAGYKSPVLQVGAGNDAQNLDDRRSLIREFDRMRGNLDLRGSFDGTDKFRDLAFQILTGPRVAAAFDLTQESDLLRDRYGRNRWGQSCLLARRLVEAGTSVVTLFIDTPKDGPEFSNWDDHIGNNGHPGHFAQYVKARLPYLDEALATLIEDLHERGLNRNVVVAVLGEFGRTPRLSQNASGTGRDHWPDAQTVLLAGGDLRMGQVVGATNSKAEYPTERPCTPQDILATLYRHLGIDSHLAFPDHAGRPVPILGDGSPIRELI